MGILLRYEYPLLLFKQISFRSIKNLVQYTISLILETFIILALRISEGVKTPYSKMVRTVSHHVY